MKESVFVQQATVLFTVAESRFDGCQKLNKKTNEISKFYNNLTEKI